MKLHGRIHTLSEIEKILTYVPMGFIVLITLLALFSGHYISRHRMENNIALLTQQESARRQSHLEHYIATVNHRITTNLSQVQKKLQRDVHLIEGIYRGLGSDDSLQKLRPYLKEMEEKEQIHFVIFDKNMTIYYGRRQLKTIENLIFDRFSDPQHLKITMLYIYSQGSQSTLSWRNDLDQTIQESYFERLPGTTLSLGAFSEVNSLRNRTIEAYIQSITQGKDQPSGYTFWLYDHLRNNVFNAMQQARWRQGNPCKNGSLCQHLNRLFLSIGISPANHQFDEKIAAIHHDYAEKEKRLLTIIVISGLILLFFARTFSNIIRRILRRYNTRLHHTHERLRHLKERYELAVVASNDGLWDTDFKSKKTFFSQKWLDILGYRPGEIQSFDSWLSLMHPDDRERVLSIIDEHKQSPHAEHMICEYRLRTRSGKYLWMLGRGKVFWDDDGRPRRLVMMSMDISDQKEASKRLEELVRQEVAKNEEKQRLLIQQNKLAAMGEMIGAIAHQWRQPLNNITLILHFIRDNIDNPDFTHSMLEHYVQRAKKQIDFMSETIDDFRDFHRPSKTKSFFDVEKAIRSTLAIMQTQLDKNRIEVILSGESFEIEGFENEFRQAILNILANAKDAIANQMQSISGFHGKILIHLSDRQSITIYNNGGPADPEVLERMFEPYFTTKFENQGTGIGLYMTRTIIEDNMHGIIRAANQDEGVVFTIILQGGTT